MPCATALCRWSEKTGGLIDTVKDIGETNGYGICYNNASVGDITHAIWRATDLYENKNKLKEVRQRMMQLDYSWESSVEQYIQVYRSF